MRGMGLFFGANKRNQPMKLSDPHPIPDYGHGSCCPGDAGNDGFSIISRADADRQGSPPSPAGIEGPLYFGPDQSFEA